MKFVSVILAAVFCATIVSAAPSATLPSIDEIVDALQRGLKCGLVVVSETVKDTEFESDWERVKPIVGKFYNDVLEICRKEPNFTEFNKCTEREMGERETEAKEFLALFERVKNENVELFNLINANVAKKCFVPPTAGQGFSF